MSSILVKSVSYLSCLRMATNDKWSEPQDMDDEFLVGNEELDRDADPALDVSLVMIEVE